MREGWEYKKLGEVCFIERGGSPRPIQQYLTDRADGLNWIKIGDAVEGSKYINSTKEKIKPEGLKKTRFIHKGDFILSNSMSFGKPYILGIDGCIHDGWLVIRDNNKIFDKSYLYYLLSSPNMYQEFKRLAVGGVVNNLNSNLVRNVVVPIPPLAEQERIVAELDLLSSIIDKKKAQLKELDQLAQSIFYDMFGDPITNEKGWEVKKLGDCCKNCDSQRKPITAKDRIKGNIPYYGASGIVDYVKDYIFDGIFLLISEDGANLIARSTPIAFSIKGKTWVNNHAHVLQFDTWYQQVYLEYSINLRDISMIVTGCAQPKLTQAALNNMKIPIPPLSLQQEFADKVEAIERQKTLIQQSIDEVQTLFDSRMDYWFD